VSKDDRPDAEPDDLPVLARPLQEYVGRNLRAYRRHKGITQERAAELLGVDVRYLRRIETGQMNLQLQTIDHIARTLEVDPLEFFTGGTWDEDTVTDQG
jgi:transcriptional regulator with XRE-family HTH domain